MPLIDHTNGQLEADLAFAESLPEPGRDSLRRAVERLSAHAVCHLYRDFAPHSFYFELAASAEDGARRYGNGGIIFYGGAESGAGAPQFSVSLSGDRHPRWEVHT
jgi:hypothetical protein